MRHGAILLTRCVARSQVMHDCYKIWLSAVVDGGRCIAAIGGLAGKWMAMERITCRIAHGPSSKQLARCDRPFLARQRPR